jgi:hypothetical protein
LGIEDADDYDILDGLRRGRQAAKREQADFPLKKTKEKDGFSPKIFTTHQKNGKQRNNKTAKTIEDGIAQSNLLSIERMLGLEGLFDGELKHLSFDCPLTLREAFKQATRENGTSYCKELQKYMVSYVATHHAQKMAFGNTLSKILKPRLVIENLNFEQYVQGRPRRLIRGRQSVGNGEPVLSLVQQKEKQFLERKNKQFKGMLEQWDETHFKADWHVKAVAEAEKYPDLEYAKLLVVKGKQRLKQNYEGSP